MTHLKKYLPPLLCLAAALPASAAPQVFTGAGFSRALKWNNPDAPYTDTATADMDGNLVPDVVFVHDDGLIILWGVGLWDAQGPITVDGSTSGIPYSADAVAAYHDDGEPRARLLVLDDGYLTVVYFDPLGSTFLPTVGWIDGSFHTIAIPGQTQHTNAQDLELADMDGDGDLDAVVHTSNSVGVQVFRNDGNDVWVPGPTKSNVGVGNGFQLSIGDSDGDGKMEIATSGDGGARNHEFDPITGIFDRVAIHTLPGEGLTDPIQFLVSNFGMGAIAYIGTVANSEYFVTMNESGTAQSLLLGQILAKALGGADFNMDGLTDLIMTQNSTGHMHVAMQLWRSVATDQYWDYLDPTKYYMLVPPGGEAPVPLFDTLPAIDDFDLDGDLDLCVPNTENETFGVNFNNTLASTTYQPQVSGMNFVESADNGAGEATEGDFHIKYDLPAANSLGPFTHLRWFVIRAVWDDVKMEYRINAATPTDTDYYGWEEFTATGGTLDVGFPWDPDKPAGQDDIAIIVARYADVDLMNQSIDRLGPHLTWCYVHSDGLYDPASTVHAAAYDFVLDLPGAYEDPVDVYWDNNPGATGGTGGEETGGGTPCDCLPIGCAPPPWPDENGIPPQGT